MVERPQFSLRSILLLLCGIGLWIGFIRLVPEPFYWVPPFGPGVLVAAGLVRTRGKALSGALKGALYSQFTFVVCCLLPNAFPGYTEVSSALAFVAYVVLCGATIGAGVQAQELGYHRLGKFLTMAGVILFFLTVLVLPIVWPPAI